MADLKDLLNEYLGLKKGESTKIVPYTEMLKKENRELAREDENLLPEIGQITEDVYQQTTPMTNEPLIVPKSEQIVPKNIETEINPKSSTIAPVKKQIIPTKITENDIETQNPPTQQEIPEAPKVSETEEPTSAQLWKQYLAMKQGVAEQQQRGNLADLIQGVSNAYSRAAGKSEMIVPEKYAAQAAAQQQNLQQMLKDYMGMKKLERIEQKEPSRKISTTFSDEKGNPLVESEGKLYNLKGELFTGKPQRSESPSLVFEREKLAALQEERLARREDREEDRRIRAEERRKLKPTEAEEVTGIDRTLETLDMISDMKRGVNTGKWAEKYQQSREWLPGTSKDTKFADLEQYSGMNLFDYVKAQSGAAYSERELQNLKNNMPNVGDDDTTFNTKLKNLKNIISKKRESKIKALQVAKKDVESLPTKQPTSAPTKQKYPVGTILKSGGKRYRIINDNQDVEEIKG